MVKSSSLDPTEKLRKRLRYQSWHRGCKETDVLLGNFCDQNLQTFDKQQLNEFESILNEDDADLYRWLTGQTSPPPHMQKNPVMRKLLEFKLCNTQKTS